MRFPGSIRVLTILLTIAPAARAQQAGAPTLGIDAGVSIVNGGSTTFTQLNLPVPRLRLAFPASERVGIEVGASLMSISGEGETFSTYSLDFGILMFSNADAAKSRMYVRPFAAYTGFSGSNSSDGSGAFGLGLGGEIPIDGRLATRLEGNYRRVMQGDGANNFGVLAGLSIKLR